MRQQHGSAVESQPFEEADGCRDGQERELGLGGNGEAPVLPCAQSLVNCSPGRITQA